MQKFNLEFNAANNPLKAPLDISLSPPQLATLTVNSLLKLSGSSNPLTANTPITVTEPNNSIGTAYDVGTLSTGNPPKVFSSTVNNSDPQDYFKITLNATSNLNVVLTGLSADADIYLYNQNGGVVLNGSFRGGTRDESINQKLAPGTYYISVQQSSGDTNYNLLLSATLAGSLVSAGLPSNLLPTEYTVPSLNAPYSRTGSLIGTFPVPTFPGNTSDVYKIHLDTARTVNVLLGGLSTDFDLRLIQDINTNRIVDVTEQIQQSQRMGTASETISANLAAGDYYIQVYSVYGNSGSYTLNIT